MQSRNGRQAIPATAPRHRAQTADSRFPRSEVVIPYFKRSLPARPASDGLSAWASVLLAAVLGLALLAMDSAIDLGIAAAVTYGVVVWIVRLSGRVFWIYAAAVVCSLFTAFGLLVSSEPSNLGPPLAHRVLALVVTWLVAILSANNLRLLQHYQQVQDSLLAEEKRSRLLLDSTGEAIYGIDLNGRCTFANAACVRLLGYESQEELLDRDMHALCHHSKADGSPYPRSECRIYRAIREPKNVHCDDEVLFRRDGASFPAEYWSQPVELDGEVFGAVVTFLDITARREQERKLRESEQFVRDYLDSLSVFAGVLSPDGILIEANRTAITFAGQQPDDVLGKPFEETWWWSWDEQVQKDLRQAIGRAAAGEAVRYDAKVRGGDNQLIDIDFQIVPMKDSEGRVTHLAPSAVDITERKELVQALQSREENQALLLSLLESERETEDASEMMAEAAARLGRHLKTDRVGFYEVSPDGDHAEFLESWTAGTLPLLEYDHWPLRAIGSGHLERCRIGETTAIGDVATNTLTSDSAFADIGTSAIISAPILRLGTWFAGLYTHHSKPREWTQEEVALVREVADQTWDGVERARARQALRESESERRLAAAELAEANRRKDEFLATLAHELRNPLAPIRTGIEILGRSKDPELVEKTRKTMERQMHLMVRLVDDLLDVSRVTRGKFQLRKEDVDLTDVLRDAIDASLPQIEAAGHDLETRLPEPGQIQLHADPSRLAQVVSNLLNNAAKFTPEGGKIELWHQVDLGSDEKAVEIVVRDHGIGVPEGRQEAIFEMFTQVDREDDQPSAGLGIGLTLVRALVEMHDGVVALREPDEGPGSQFHVRLPLTEASSEAVGAPDSTEAADHPVQPLRVLVVDDRVESADAMQLLLELCGHEPRTAHDGAEAVRIAEEFAPHVVLMDIGMPIMDGYEAARAMRAAPWGEDITLIALTGWGQTDDKEEAIAAGFDQHFTKPIQPSVLEDLLRDEAQKRSLEDTDL